MSASGVPPDAPCREASGSTAGLSCWTLGSGSGSTEFELVAGWTLVRVGSWLDTGIRNGFDYIPTTDHSNKTKSTKLKRSRQRANVANARRKRKMHVLRPFLSAWGDHIHRAKKNAKIF